MPDSNFTYRTPDKFAISQPDEVRTPTISAHAFTCEKCGSHVVRWHNDIFYCQSCGEPNKKKTTKTS